MKRHSKRAPRPNFVFFNSQRVFQRVRRLPHRLTAARLFSHGGKCGGGGVALIVFALLIMSTPANAQSDPWSSMANKLAPIFTGPVARGFTLVGCVIGGLQLIFGEGGGKRMIGGLLFGGALALGAAQLISALLS